VNTSGEQKEQDSVPPARSEPNWWKWTILAGVTLVTLACAAGGIAWAIGGPPLAGEVAAWVCGLGLPVALIIEAVAARKARR
jgi:hypothetical protein